jgi:hypothetical protein
VSIAQFAEFLDGLLGRDGSVKVRRTIEHEARCAGFSPTEVTNGLRALRDDPSSPVTLTRLEGSHVYSNGPANPKSLALCKVALQNRKQFLSSAQLKLAGELYARQLFVRRRAEGMYQIGRIPQLSMWGHFPLEGLPSREKADGLLPYHERTGALYTLFIEVKNIREHIHLGSRDPYIADIIRQSRFTGTQPVLIAAHIEHKAISFCNAVGVALLVLGKQLIRHTDKSLAAESFSTWREQYQSIRIKRPIEFKPTAFSQQHLSAITPQWIEGAHRRWVSNAAVLPEIQRCLEQRHFSDLEYPINY